MRGRRLWLLPPTVLGERRFEWLGAERDKVEYFSTATSLRLKELPHLVFGAGPDKTVRYFPDKLPIGITGDGRTHVLLYAPRARR